ncbi:MAG: alpha/beta hydrolase [Myxococcota bacterium]
MRASSYAELDHWRAYQPYLPPAWRLEGDRIPDERWWRYDDIEVHLDELAADDPQATVIMLHGGGGNGRILMCAAPLLREHGCSVVAPDLPGYGLTRVPPRHRLTYNLWADIAARLASELARERRHPVLVFGLSLGGLLAYGTAARSRDVAGVIATTLADTRRPEVLAAISRLPLPGRISSAILRATPPALHGARLPIRWLSPMHLITNSPALSDVFVRDPLAGGSRVSIGFLRSLVEFDVRLEPEHFDRCPVLCPHPAADPWTPAKLSRPFFDRIAGPKRWVDLEGCGHFPYEEPGAGRLVKAVHHFIDELSSR